MALRASRSTSTSSLLSKFASAAKSAASYQDAKMADDYSTGAITSEEYKSYLTAKKKSLTPGTSSYLSLTKRLRSVEADISQNELQTKVDLGLADPADLADVISQRVVDEGILEGTPEYNRILKAVVNLRDQSVNYEKRQKAQEYKEMSRVDPSMADKMWDDYLSSLPSRYSSQILVESAQRDAENFHATRVKSEIARAINQTSKELKAQGIRGSSYYAAMRDVYNQGAGIAEQNGLIDYANTLISYAATSNQSYASAADSEIKSSGYKDAQLAAARTYDLKQQLKEAEKSGDMQLLNDLNNQIISNLQLEAEINNNINKPDVATTKKNEVSTYTDNLTKLASTFKITPDGRVLSQGVIFPDGEMYEAIPQKGDYILHKNAKGEVEFKEINQINSDGSFTFEGQAEIGADGNKAPNFVIDTVTGQAVEVNYDGTTGKFYIQDAEKGNIDVAPDKSGKNHILGEEMGGGVYRNVKADGGYDFVKYDGKNAEPILLDKAVEESKKQPTDLLAGSTSKDDQKILEYLKNPVAYDINQLNPNNPNVGVLKDLLKNQETAEKQRAEAQKALEAQQAEQAKTALPTPSDLVSGIQQNAPVPTPEPVYVPPTQLIAPKPVEPQPAYTPQGVNFQAAQPQKIADGYWRVPKPDGGFDFVKSPTMPSGLGGNISVDDLARETRIAKKLLLDKKTTSFKLI